jgi:hypothetical protein
MTDTRTPKPIDPRWIEIAETWLDDCEVHASTVKRLAPTLADRLADVAENFVDDDVAQWEQDREQAAYDAHINHQIDVARGK